MCGFVGFNFANEELLRQALKSIKHRGPDGSDFYVDKNFSVGHNLLSIRGEVDKSLQPVTNNNSEWLLAFNGQIYNLDDLKTNLDERFNSETLDTTILFEIINKFGWRFIDYIEGMYSIVLINKNTEEVRIYRDESGQKPLYYSFDGKRFSFSSEIKALLALGVDRKIDNESISFYTHLGYLPGSKTIFKRIKKVLPGEIIILDKQKKELISNNINFLNKNPDQFLFKDIKKDIVSLLDIHLQSKTKVSVNLSGGMDSSSLLWAAKHSDKEVTALTTLFLDSPATYNEEVKLARSLCSNLNIDHEVLDISKKDFLDNFVEAYQTVEEPNGNVAIPLYLITAKKHKRDNNTVVISGDGGDETWGGYNHHFKSFKLDSRILPFLTKFKIQNFLKRKVYFDISNPVERYLYYRTSQSSFNQNRMQSLKKYLKEELKFLNNIVEFKKLSTTQKMFCIERMTWLSEENFMRSDKIYMSQGLEVRSPLAYPPFRNNFNSKFKLEELWSNGYNKYPLRSSLNNHMIDSINWRRAKVGWKAPIEEKWYDNDFRDLLYSLFSRRNTDNVQWESLQNHISSTKEYPGKLINYFASLAIISDMYNIEI